MLLYVFLNYQDIACKMSSQSRALLIRNWQHSPLYPAELGNRNQSQSKKHLKLRIIEDDFSFGLSVLYSLQAITRSSFKIVLLRYIVSTKDLLHTSY